MTTHKTSLHFARAYATGYYDGRTKGEEYNIYTDDTQRHAYRLGYDSGVADYCDDMEGEAQ